MNPITLAGVVSCETARRQYSYISCTNDGSYNMTQCRNKYCVCVNATTGEVFSGSETFRIGSKEANYCRQCTYYDRIRDMHKMSLIAFFSGAVWRMEV